MPELREFEHLLNDCGDGLWIDDVMVVSPGDKNGSGLFLQIPFLDLREGLTNKRFMSALLIANFVLIPLLVWGLTRGLTDHPAILVGALLMLLRPTTLPRWDAVATR